MTNADLGELRRTHYADELSDVGDGRSVTVMGWILTVRNHGNLTFATIRDKNGDIQIVAKKGECRDLIREKISSLKPHSSVAVVGSVRESKKAPDGFELVPTELRIFSSVQKIPPIDPLAKTVKNIETRLLVRTIDLRRDTLRHIFQTRSWVLSSIRQYMKEQSFVEINTPKIISSATEGGSSLFQIFYYNKQAFLAQSPQLYKEQLTMSFEKVFEIGPIFRAEASRTNRHLSEAISIDIEEAFVDYNDIMDRVESMIRTAVNCVQACEHQMDIPNFAVPALPKPVPRHTYSEMLEKIQKAGIDAEWGDDLHPSWLAKINMTGFYFITDWPLGPKPFYVKQHPGNSDLSESFDLMFGTLELSSGSTRISDRDDITKRMTDKGMNVDAFKYHLDAFDYGMPPHAGCGIGLERLMMALTGIENIRDATFYPRDVDRLVP